MERLGNRHLSLDGCPGCRHRGNAVFLLSHPDGQCGHGVHAGQPSSPLHPLPEEELDQRAPVKARWGGLASTERCFLHCGASGSAVVSMAGGAERCWLSEAVSQWAQTLPGSPLGESVGTRHRREKGWLQSAEGPLGGSVRRCGSRRACLFVIHVSYASLHKESPQRGGLKQHDCFCGRDPRRSSAGSSARGLTGCRPGVIGAAGVSSEGSTGPGLLPGPRDCRRRSVPWPLG